MGLSLLKGAVGNVWSWLISKVVWRLVLGVVGGVELGPIVVLWAIVLGCTRVVPWSVLLWWLAVLVVRLSKIFSYLAIGCDKGILTSGNSSEDITNCITNTKKVHYIIYFSPSTPKTVGVVF